MDDYIKTLTERRLSLWEQAKRIVDGAEAEKRELTAEETANFDKFNDDLRQIDDNVDRFRTAAERAALADAKRDALGDAARQKSDTGAPSFEREVRRAILSGRDFEVGPTAMTMRVDGESRTVPLAEHRSSMSEREIRAAITGGSTGAPKPTSFYDQLVWHQVQVGTIRQASTVVATQSGENMQFARTSANSSFALISDAGTFTNTEPTFSAFITLGAYKLGGLIQVSTEMAEDEGVDLLGWLAEQAGVGIGVGQNTYLTTGTGSSQPTGITVNASTGVTGGTAVSGAFTADNVIDMLYSVGPQYRRLPNTQWQARDASISAIRKLKDSQNRYLWEPSMQAGQPDSLLGFPIVSNPDIAATALSAKSLLFGNIPRFYVREVKGVRFERSDEFAFGTGLISYRAYLRFDSNLIDQTGAVKVFVGGAS